jgi:Tol biopolymer transport system component
MTATDTAVELPAVARLDLEHIGTEIAFVRRLPPNRVFVMNADGTDQHVVLPSGGPTFVPAWQPRGERLND